MNINYLKDINTLKIYSAHNIYMVSLINIHRLELFNVRIPYSDYYLLVNVHTLCSDSINLNSYTIRYLENVYILDIRWHNGILDMAQFGNIYALYLYECREINKKSLRALNNIHTLDTYCCGDMINIDTCLFANVHTINIRFRQP